MATPYPTPVITPGVKPKPVQPPKPAPAPPRPPQVIPTPHPTPTNQLPGSGSGGSIAPTPIYAPGYAPPGQILGQNNQPSPQPQPNSGGGSSGGGITEQQAIQLGLDWNNLPGGYSRIEGGGGGYDEEAFANEEYNNTMNYLSGVENWLKEQYATANRTIQDSESQNKKSLDEEMGIYRKELAGNRTKADKRRLDAISAAQRMYAELQMGNRQRFGGSSSAGDAMSEIQGAEQMRQQGQTMDTYNTYMQDSELSEERTQKNYNDAIAQIASQAQQAKQAVLSEFTSKMLEIQNDRNMAAQQKQQRRVDALRELRDKQFAISQQELQFKQQMEVASHNARLQVQTNRQAEAGSFDALNTNMSLKPQTNYRIGATSFTTYDSPIWVGKISQFALGEDEMGRTVFWNPSTQNFEFSMDKYDAAGNMVGQNYGFTGTPLNFGQALNSPGLAY